ncbi:GGDEF domain-containing protein [Archangium violaceum]|uniref:GGDEF domain-containing protein n=1 Tax=Archangium violaceum TaxID=83451 RepID=UPI00193BD136|nr:GGDEF domain-containing protein [Archangium violaceum]QRK08144.1 GGDEF domain-containing protein [Archangium violaceum]
MRITRALVIEPAAAGRRKLKEGLEKAGLEVSAVAEWEEEPGRAQVVVLGPSVERAAQVARTVRKRLPQALVLAAGESHGKAGFADGVLPLPVSPRDLKVRLPELMKLRTLSRGTPVRKGRAAPASEPVRASGEGLLDPLTQFYVFAHFKDFVFVEVKRSRRYGLPLALALVAFDPLPVKGDRALREQLHGGLALAIRRSLRDTDFPVQYSADHVLLLLPHTDLAGAHTVARRVCERVARSSLSFDDQLLRPTVSVGLAALAPGREVSFADLVRQARGSLDLAREAGGNRVEMLAETPGLEFEGT